MTNTATDFEQARHNMVEQQIRPWNVLDQRVLDKIEGLARDRFVPKRYRDISYADTQIDIGHSQIMMTPKEEARMLQALAIKPSDTVLEIGTGTGYCTALMASLAKHVYSVDIIAEFIESASQITSKLGLSNIEFEEGDAANGWPHHKPYDAIAITGSYYQLPETYLTHLSIGGRLFCVTGTEPAMQAQIITRLGEEEWHYETLYETVIPKLINSQPKPQFSF
ncbi:protein-L-isoaspartate O-methyltransferase family protein [Kangiella sediminilitoris]|uniref:Protein-L-isoaspartate O-methyltransferase n=1 Tax=Kangiella sediminilitoris TaxID=1144748 RepID=A0A1B3B922_9GAMM|nr:protein-L-isoaspartate O-methyltransferase [Kangiella sediminilitoris]AOE49275.1 protein-L-isoaspartate O-methyltransferase [Kangiella sediminilitoris]